MVVVERRCWISILLLLFLALPGCSKRRLLPSEGVVSSIATESKTELHDTSEATSLNLEEALEIAFTNNPNLKALSNDSRAARARISHERAEGKFRLDLDAGISEHHLDQRLVMPTGNGVPTVFGNTLGVVGTVLRVPIDANGKQREKVRSAKASAEVTEQQGERFRQELAYGVKRVFYAILAQSNVLASLNFSTKQLEKHRERVANLLQAKKVAHVDVLRIDVRLADLRQKIVSEQGVLDVLRHRLAYMLGRPRNSSALNVDGELSSVEKEKQVSISFEEVLKQRPDYQASRFNLEANKARVRSLRSHKKPDVEMRASAGRRWMIDPTEQPTGTEKAENVGFVGLFLDLPLFDSGRLAASIKEEEEKLSASRERLAAVEAKVCLDLASAQADCKTAKARVKATKSSIAQAKESLRIAMDRHAFGKGSLTDILDAQSAHLDAQTNYARSLASLHTALASLLLAQGDM